MKPGYRVISHTADTGIEADAASLAELYATCAYAMFDLMVDLTELEPEGELRVHASSTDPAGVLVDLLSELLALAEIEGVLFCTFRTTGATETGAELVAGTFPMARTELRGPPIKAVTYHDLAVAPTPSGWRARVLFDV